MNCCSECFLDVELKGFIYSNSNGTGQCDFCETVDISLVDVLELQEQFIPLLDIYTLDADGEGIVSALQNDWNIFRLSNSDKIKELLSVIIEGLDEEYNTLINSTVSIIIPDETKEFIENWELFKKEIKEENRFFFNNKANLESLEEILPIRDYSSGKIFYRSRISDDERGYPITKMGKPPHKSSKSGRANPRGIAYLYVAQSIETTMYEARATFLDFVSIGKYKLKEDIKVISLRTSFQVSPWSDFSLEDYVKNKPFLDILESDLAKPLRRQDNELDYLPTQYLCEYIKSLGYDGVEYGSSLHEDGINLVIFNDEKLECNSVEVHEISKIEIQSELL
ncbi:RES domain-containing protein [Lacinutrix iliipiscaria]|uniref:RES domain-containing protein n=1 Tax=Lacinutrix iliipiscaria TaxID=1230532 RepID=A0ABW5WN13_9FLAO